MQRIESYNLLGGVRGVPSASGKSAPDATDRMLWMFHQRMAIAYKRDRDIPAKRRRPEQPARSRAPAVGSVEKRPAGPAILASNRHARRQVGPTGILRRLAANDPVVLEELRRDPALAAELLANVDRLILQLRAEQC